MLQTLALGPNNAHIVHPMSSLTASVAPQVRADLEAAAQLALRGTVMAPSKNRSPDGSCHIVPVALDSSKVRSREATDYGCNMAATLNRVAQRLL